MSEPMTFSVDITSPYNVDEEDWALYAKVGVLPEDMNERGVYGSSIGSVTFQTFEDLKAFLREYGTVVMSIAGEGDIRIEIYNDYRE